MNKGGTGIDVGLWRKLIEVLFCEFIEYFLSKDSDDYDLSSVVFCDKELEVIRPDKEDDRLKKYCDILIGVGLKSDKSKVELIHIEIEGSSRGDLARRMFIYRSLIFSKFLIPIRSFAVIVSPRKKIKNRFNYKKSDSILDFGFGYATVMNQDPHLLKNEENIFALIILATRLCLLKKKMSEQDLMDEFEWIYSKLVKWKSTDNKYSAVAVYINDCLRKCLGNKKNFCHFEKKIDYITKNRKTMGIVETIKKEAQEVGREEGREVGREEGMEELKIRLVKSFLVDKGFSISETASLFGLTEYFVRKVKRGL